MESLVQTLFILIVCRFVWIIESQALAPLFSRGNCIFVSFVGAPLTALVTGSVLGGGILLFLWFAVPNAIERLFGICMLSSCVVYVSIFCSFLTARTRLDTVPRAFNSPFGTWGARYGIVVFSVMAIALIGFQRDNGTSVTVFCGGVLLALAHYWFIARKREFLSMEEQVQLATSSVVLSNCLRSQSLLT